MKIVPLLVSLCFFYFCALFSQDNSTFTPLKTVNESTLFGVGKTFLDDTYLSPLTYNGLSMTLLHDRIRATRHFNGSMLLQQQFSIQVAITKNPTASASEYYGNLDYILSGYYPVARSSRFLLYGGGGGEASLGGIYNERNTNNPGSLKTSLNLNLSAMAVYNWQNITFRWQLSTPFLGIFFSPEYGHSYYEIFTLGNNKGTVHLGSFHNRWSLRNYFTVDIPMGNITLRTGYLGDYCRTNVNLLDTKIISHQFLIGMKVESLNFGGKKARNNKHIESVF
ncbi:MULTISPECIES: DUF3316 domain-containing protein [Proteiniphilum]|mgnify:CR=1 FL=1|jgi:hypothetical protein|uniref:DUF3316 domain-containing protein n=1 Tax=Proteiniphilum TaxID=294702 RepID=UPI001EEAD4ED|nr:MULTISPECIES: DUF3316 domain-containing protein [Proteiniphilum]ULB33380.1 DUF3316 domain-containing protein [Proteiniphilum propionicum]